MAPSAASSPAPWGHRAGPPWSPPSGRTLCSDRGSAPARRKSVRRPRGAGESERRGAGPALRPRRRGRAAGEESPRGGALPPPAPPLWSRGLAVVPRLEPERGQLRELLLAPLRRHPERHALPLRPVGWPHLHGEYAPGGIDEPGALAPLTLFRPLGAARAAPPGRLDALAIEAARAALRVALEGVMPF